MSVKTFQFIFACLLGLFLLPVQGISADQDVFDIYPLEVQGVIYDFINGDFDGDGLGDIGVIYAAEGDYYTRYIGLHLQDQNTGFRRNADYLTTLPTTAAQINAADIDDDAVDEILIIDSEGVSVLRFSINAGLSKPVRVVRQKTVFSFPLNHGIIVMPFLFDINDSPGPEMIIPGQQGYLILEQGDRGNYQLLNQLEISAAAQNHDKYFNEFARLPYIDLDLSFPGIHVADGNLDGRNDIYLIWDRKLAGFFQDQSGNFAQKPDFEIDFYPAHVRGYLQSRLVDFNGDNRPDVAVSNTSGGMTNTNTIIRFYLAGTDGKINPLYKKEINLSDSYCNLILGDVNGDRRTDLVVPAIEVGAMAATKVFLTKKTDLHMLVYQFTGGIPENEPNHRLRYEFRFNFNDPMPTAEVAVDWSTDYNGDNIPDMVFCSGNDEIKFYWGETAEYLPRRPNVEIGLDHPMQIHPVNLNKGNFNDVVIRHNLGGTIDKITVLKNSSS